MTAVAERSHLDILPDTPLSRPGFRDNALRSLPPEWWLPGRRASCERDCQFIIEQLAWHFSGKRPNGTEPAAG
jgi:hypothetical protein